MVRPAADHVVLGRERRYRSAIPLAVSLGAILRLKENPQPCHPHLLQPFKIVNVNVLLRPPDVDSRESVMVANDEEPLLSSRQGHVESPGVAQEANRPCRVGADCTENDCMLFSSLETIDGGDLYHVGSLSKSLPHADLEACSLCRIRRDDTDRRRILSVF